MTQTWFYWALLSAVFAALTAIFAKVGISEIDSDFATLIRTVFILIVLSVFVWQTHKGSALDTLTAKNWIFLFLSAIASGASWVFYFRALQSGQASQVAPVDKLSLVLVVCFAFLFLGERPTPKEWLGILLISSGVLVFAIKK